MPYKVLLQSAVGRSRDIRVIARNDSDAVRQALRAAEREQPGEGWRAVWALPW